jgi:hypothetical protein
MRLILLSLICLCCIHIGCSSDNKTTNGHITGTWTVSSVTTTKDSLDIAGFAVLMNLNDLVGSKIQFSESRIEFRLADGSESTVYQQLDIQDSIIIYKKMDQGITDTMNYKVYKGDSLTLIFDNLMYILSKTSL